MEQTDGRSTVSLIAPLRRGHKDITHAVNINRFVVAAIKVNEICSWLPPFCKQNLLLFIQPKWQLRRTYLFNHYNVLF